MRRAIGIAVALALVGTLVIAVDRPEEAVAANGADFNPGYIISDEQFYNGAAMSGEDVQVFVASKEGTCVVGYTCMMSYTQRTPNMPADQYCKAYTGTGAGVERAADIIAKVGAACNISQKAILVLLEKEQSLVTMRNPSPGRFAAATGFSCPDTAPCDPSFAGFFYQVYYAARQFQRYAATPNSWNYQAGRTNNILYHPDAGRCGSGPVYIQNKATAGLYIYTPYQPNPAALANLYGTGDACSSYGNRNFWRLYTDWFGSPTEASSLVRTESNATVWLISGDNKYAVPSLPILAALAPLGQVSYVSQAYLDRFTTAHNVGRTIRGPDGSIYFFDAGIKLPLTSCEQAVDYGASCAPNGYVQLTQAQTAAFVTGPPLSPVLGTTSGARYYIKSGKRAEILDDASQLAAGIPLGMNVLSDGAVSHLPIADPIVRDGVYILTRGTASYSLYTAGLRYAIADGSAPGLGVPARTSGSLANESLTLLPKAPVPFAGVISVTAGSATVLTSDGRYDLTAGGLSPSVSAVPVPQGLLDSYPVKGVIQEASFIKSPTNGTVWVVMPTDIRPVTSWDALLALTTDNNPIITVVSQSLIDMLTKGPDALIAGTLVRSPENATVYFINGVTSRIPLSRFEYPVEAGFNQLVFASETRIQGYPLATMDMTFGFLCGETRYVAAGGSVHLVGPEVLALYPFDYVPMDRFTCGRMKIGVPAGAFIRTPDGTIWQLVDGQKRPIASMTRLGELGATSWLNVPWLFADKYPTGPLA